jgi:hypothetical protein
MMQRLLNRIEALANAGSGGQWRVFAIFSAALVGFQLASYKYGHSDPGQLAFSTGFFLMSVFFIVTHRLLRVVLFISATALMFVALVMIGLYSPHLR